MTDKEQISLYNGEVEITFYPKSHRYKKDKKYIPSPSAILGIIDKSRQLIHWAVNLDIDFLQNKLEKFGEITEQDLEEARNKHNEKRDAEASLGSEVHKFAEEYALWKLGKGEEPKIETEDERTLNGIYAFLNWLSQNNVEFIEAERVVYSKKYNYVGTADAIAIVNGQKVLIDYKTGKGVYNSAYYQTMAYKMAYEEETKEKLKDCLILHFGKEDGQFSVHSLKKEKTLKVAKDGFLTALKLFLIEKL